MTPTQKQVPIFLSIILMNTAIIGIQGSWFTYHDDWRTESVAKFKAFSEQTATEDFMKDDAYLLRWLKALDFDLDVATSNLEKTVQWRKRHNLSSILYETFTPGFIQEFPILMDASEDKGGRPIMVIPIGHFNLRKGTLAGHQNTIIRHITRILEIAERYIHIKRFNGSRYRDISQTLAIVDLQGFNVVSTGCWKCLKLVPEMVPILEGYYRQIFSEIIFINAPKIFDAMLNLIKSLMSDATRESIQLYDTNSDHWREALLERISPENLPVLYGGMRLKSRGNEVEKMVLAFDKSQWKSVATIELGGSVSTSDFPSTSRPVEYEVSDRSDNSDKQTPEEFHVSYKHEQSHHHHYTSNNSREATKEMPPHHSANLVIEEELKKYELSVTSRHDYEIVKPSTYSLNSHSHSPSVWSSSYEISLSLVTYLLLVICRIN